MKQIWTLASVRANNLKKAIELAKRIQTSTRKSPGNNFEAFINKRLTEIGKMSHHYNFCPGISRRASELQAV